MNGQTHELHVVFGTGAMGAAIMHELITRGKRVRMVNRSGKPALATGSPAGVEFRAADVFNAESALSAAEGATHIYQAAQPEYHEWAEKFPPMQRNILSAAAALDARLIVVENLYMYGDPNGQPIREDLPYRPVAKKGVVRTQMTDELWQAHAKGSVRVVTGRGADFYGPGYMIMGEQVFYPALAGKQANGLFQLDIPHSFTYTVDFGKALVILGEHESAFGQAWHVPTPEPITQRDLISLAFEAAGTTPKIGAINMLMMRIGGLFMPGARETLEMAYEFDKPFVLDSSRFTQKFGMQPTPYRDAIRATVEWFRAYPLEK
jgi:nucleoside-diphosphate-sugar epimerase